MSLWETVFIKYLIILKKYSVRNWAKSFTIFFVFSELYSIS